MKQKKLVAGVVATAMVLSTGAAAYAAEAQDSDQLTTAVECQAATVAEGNLSFDETQAPDGVAYTVDLSLSDEAGILTFDVGEIPEDVQITMGDMDAAELVESIPAEGLDGTLTFDETDLPAGIAFAKEGSNILYQDIVDPE